MYKIEVTKMGQNYPLSCSVVITYEIDSHLVNISRAAVL